MPCKEYTMSAAGFKIISAHKKLYVNEYELMNLYHQTGEVKTL